MIVLHSLEELDSSTDQSVRVLSRAIQEGDWELCKELARFLAGMDDTGEALKEVMQTVNMGGRCGAGSDGIQVRLEMPSPRLANGGGNGNGWREAEDCDGTESDMPSASDVSSVGSTVSRMNGYRLP